MDYTAYQAKLSANLPGIELLFNEPMWKHTSFRIGGNAEVMAFPHSVEEVSALLRLEPQAAILGAGTNVLAPDQGLPGLVICLKDGLDGMEQPDGTHIRVLSGVTMSRMAVYAVNLGLSGLEFAHGIPGSVGGGIYMNAGAYGSEMKDVCERVETVDRQGNLQIFSAEEMGFSYRHSRLEDNGSVVTAAVFRLKPAPRDEIRQKMRELMAKRSASQPLELPSAGSAFKRPASGYAAALIDQAGLKGFQIGGAAISEKHAGFAVNLGGATAEDVRKLLSAVSDRVFEHSGIRLEPEIRIW